jgi:hypothetical protein
MTAKSVIASMLICGTALAVVAHPKKKKKPGPQFLMDKTQDWGPEEVMDPNCQVLGNGYVLYYNEKMNREGIGSTCTAAITDSTVNVPLPPVRHRS